MSKKYGRRTIAPQTQPEPQPPALDGLRQDGDRNAAGRCTGPLLEELAGLGKAREWGENLLADIADFKVGRIRWDDMDRGAVIYGPPGTGKTTFARALANSAGIGFIATSYAEWQRTREGHLGDVTGAIHAVFQRARMLVKEKSLCIVFIDEIENLPARAGNDVGRHRDWWTSIVNAVLEELDGIERRFGVIVIGACNDASRLDPALVRPGRLDRMIEIGRPDQEGLAGIYRYHLGEDLATVDLSGLTVASLGLVGADVESVVRQARRIARKQARALSLDDLHQALDGEGMVLPEAFLRRTAVHEAGHAVVAVALDLVDDVTISIVQRGNKLGVTATEPRLQCQTLAVLEAQIALQLGGRAAEQIVLGSVAAGAGGPPESDLGRATDLAIRIFSSYGMSESGGQVWYGEQAREHLLFTNSLASQEIRATLDRCYGHALTIIENHRGAVEEIADALMIERGLSGTQIRAILARYLRPLAAE